LPENLSKVSVKKLNRLGNKNKSWVEKSCLKIKIKLVEIVISLKTIIKGSLKHHRQTV